MPWSIADGDYGRTPPVWANASDRVSYDRAFREDPQQAALEARALATASPLTPNAAIVASLAAPVPAGPQMTGAATVPPGIDDVWSGTVFAPPYLWDRPPTDYSGTPAGPEASSRPSLPSW